MSSPRDAEGAEQLPYWHVNIPIAHRSVQCPAFLLHVSDKDRGILSTRDEDYRRSTWEDVKDIKVARNDLASFRRVPTDLRRYLEFKSAIVQQYGSVLHFVRHQRLHWDFIEPSGDAHFINSTDYKILWNDWPYGIDTDITHLVVWTKFAFEVDPVTDDITPSVRSSIEDFVRRKFCVLEEGGVDRTRVIWFKNWASLRSVDAIEHFHVMLYRAKRSFVEKITHGDRPLVERIGDGNAAVLDIVTTTDGFASRSD